MLSKLIKYDMKALNHFLIFIHLFLLIISIAGRVFITGHIDFNSGEISTILFVLAIMLYFILLIGAAFGTEIIIAVRFYKNIYSDEGYLTNTLPVTRGQILLSKIITGSIWCIIDILTVYACIIILAATPYVIEQVKVHGSEFLLEFGCTEPGSIQKMIFYFLLITLIGGISSVIMLYSSIVIGQLFGNHRVLSSVITYFVLSTLISILSLLFMAVSGNLTAPMKAAMDGATFVPYQYYMNTFSLTLILNIITSIVMYGISYWLMRKKLNLN
jgi:hypothetical protein